MRRHAILITLLVSEAGVAALAIFFHVRSRPLVLGAFHEFNTALPPTTALALTPWFVPSALAAAALFTAIALLAPIGRARRPVLLSAGLLILSFALIFAVWAAFWPIFQPA